MSKVLGLGKAVSSAGLLAIGLAAGWQGLFAAKAERAMLGRPVVVVRSPIEGTLERAETSEGVILAAGAEPFEVRNLRVDTARSAELAQKHASLSADLATLEANVAALKELQAGYRVRDSASRSVQVTQLRSLLAAANASSAARMTAAAASAIESQRTRSLLEQGLASPRQVEQAQASEQQAAADAEQLQHQAKSLDAVLHAVSNGVPIDVSNGSAFAYARQRVDDVTLLLMNREQELQQRRALLDAMRAELETERRRVSLLSEARFGPGARTKVWKRLASQGEFVRVGQPVAEALDCMQGFISALVSVRTARHVQLGSSARVVLAGQTRQYQGVVTSLGGYTAASPIAPTLDPPPPKPGSSDELLLAVIRLKDGGDEQMRHDCVAGVDADVFF